jgi:hypothetical protein
MNKHRKSLGVNNSTLVVNNKTSSKKAKTIKSLPDSEATSKKFVPFPLSSVYGRSQEDLDLLLQGWRLENEAVEQLAREKRRNPG